MAETETPWREPFYADSFRRFTLRYRRRRFDLLLDRLRLFGNRRLRILDLGGYEKFWTDLAFDFSGHDLTILNLPGEVKPAQNPGVRTVEGDACELKQYQRGDFDVVFSNSVIEHVGSWERQQAMAAEIRRLADCYFVQTPSYWFPLEPHFHVPGFQWLPVELRTKLIQNYKLGLMPRFPDEAMARQCADGTQLLTRAQCLSLFPDSDLLSERVAGLVKSYIAVRWVAP